jgi:hypothetical protein
LTATSGILLDGSTIFFRNGTVLTVDSVEKGILLTRGSLATAAKYIWLDLKGNKTGIESWDNSLFQLSGPLGDVGAAKPALSIEGCEDYCILASNNGRVVMNYQPEDETKLNLFLESSPHPPGTPPLIFVAQNSQVYILHTINQWCGRYSATSGGYAVGTTFGSYFQVVTKPGEAIFSSNCNSPQLFTNIGMQTILNEGESCPLGSFPQSIKNQDEIVLYTYCTSDFGTGTLGNQSKDNAPPFIKRINYNQDLRRLNF